MISQEKEIKKLKAMLLKVVEINYILLNFHNLPILRKLNNEIKKELEKLKNEDMDRPLPLP